MDGLFLGPDYYHIVRGIFNEGLKPFGGTAMAYFPDLTPYTYIPEDEGPLLNVGWLDADHPYEQGDLPGPFIERLAWLCVNATVKGTPGIHMCGLCPPMPFGFHVIRMDGRQTVLGSAEIRVTGLTGAYASPDLILHYVMAHGYRPPDDFIEGVLMLKTALPPDQWSLARGPQWG